NAIDISVLAAGQNMTAPRVGVIPERIVGSPSRKRNKVMSRINFLGEKIDVIGGLIKGIYNATSTVPKGLVVHISFLDYEQAGRTMIGQLFLRPYTDCKSWDEAFGWRKLETNILGHKIT